jgi:hypothetical protein
MASFVLFYTSRVIGKGQLIMEELILSLKHYWRFVDLEALEFPALSEGRSGKSAWIQANVIVQKTQTHLGASITVSATLGRSGDQPLPPWRGKVGMGGCKSLAHSR